MNKNEEQEKNQLNDTRWKCEMLHSFAKKITPKKL